MALPLDQVIREQRFLTAHPEWSIFSQDKGSRFTAECTEPIHVIAALSLRELLDRLDEIVAGQ
ncbi:MAG TPA: hypothetical protein VG253_12080 [Streptosporangiaceae bacterium]|jgi:hypothetical protein|nr:hypothetical protein [Streptosporangiaceae bacterium]